MSDDPLSGFTELLVSRAIPLGLVAEGDRERIRDRHVQDSLRALPLLGASGRVVDIGSGAGLPGIPLAIARPDLMFVLAEPKTRAVAFLELAVEQLGLTNVEVRHARIEELELEADAATARAFGSAERSWAAACHVLRRGGRLIYFAGASWTERTITRPEAPSSIEVAELESSAPLVIMAREE